MKLHFAHDNAAHYRKTVRRDESGRPKKKTKTTGQMPLSQARLLGGEGKSEREQDFYQDDKIGYDDKENEAYLNALPLVKVVDRPSIEAQKERF